MSQADGAIDMNACQTALYLDGIMVASVPWVEDVASLIVPNVREVSIL